MVKGVDFLKYALLRVDIKNINKIIIVDYKHYEKYCNAQCDDYYNFVGTVETELTPSELVHGFSGSAENRAEKYKRQLKQISRCINI